MIEFKLSQQEIEQLDNEVANFDIILNALKEHQDIELIIEEAENIIII